MGQLLQTMAEKQKSPIYTYVFTHVPIDWAEAGVYAYHGLEVSYQYGVVDTVVRIYGTSLLPADPSVPVYPGINDDDYWLQDVVMTMWANFAATGDPTCARRHKYKKYCKCKKKDKLITWDWPSYDSSDLYLDIGVPPIVSTGFSELTEFLPPRY
jgi:para-nitrobenzyl esterase